MSQKRVARKQRTIRLTHSGRLGVLANCPFIVNDVEKMVVVDVDLDSAENQRPTQQLLPPLLLVHRSVCFAPLPPSPD